MITKLSFKEEVDKYFIKKYSILEATTTRIIIKRNRDLESSNIIAAAYLYVLENEQKIIDFSILYNKSIEHTIYSFCIKFIDKSLFWSNSKINAENDKLFKRVDNIDTEEIDNTIFIEFEDNIYTEEFIKGFYNSLSKLDAICFNIYYYEGIEKAKDFAEHFDISLSSAYLSINKLKQLLKEYIKNNQIH